MATKTRVKTIDNKTFRFLRIMEEVSKLKKRPYVKAGYPMESQKTSDKHGDALTVLEIALVHEFGSPEQNIPERSHVRAAADEGREELNKLTERLVKQIYDGSMTVEAALDILGLKMVSQIQAKIRKGPFQPLKQQTIDRKGSNKPLIDTAQMLNSVTFQRIMPK